MTPASPLRGAAGLQALLEREGLDAEARRIPFLAEQVDLVELATDLWRRLPVVALDLVPAEVDEGAPAIAEGVDFFQLVVVDGGEPLGLAPRRELLGNAKADAARVGRVLWQPSEDRWAWSIPHRKNVRVVSIDEAAQTATLRVPLRWGRERSESGSLSNLSPERVRVQTTGGARYVEPDTPDALAAAAQNGRPGARRRSGHVDVDVSAEPLGRGAYYSVNLATALSGENVRVPVSEIPDIENAAERYDRIAAEALARSEHMRVHGAWRGGPGTGRTWEGWVIERIPAARGRRRARVPFTDGWRWRWLVGADAPVLRVEGLPCADGSFEGWVNYRAGKPIAQRSDVQPEALAYAHGEAPRIPSAGLNHAHRDVGAVRVVVTPTEKFYRASLPVAELKRIGINAPTPKKRFFGMTPEVAQGKLRDWLLTEKGVACELVREGDLPQIATRHPTLAAPTEQTLEVARRGRVPVEPKPRTRGYGLWAVTRERWVAIRPDGSAVLAPGPEGSVETWPTEAAALEAIVAARNAERSRR